MLPIVDHAAERAALRGGITREEIEYAWARPVGPTTDGNRPGTRKFSGRLPSGTLLTFVVARDDRRRIITVWRERRSK